MAFKSLFRDTLTITLNVLRACMTAIDLVIHSNIIIEPLYYDNTRKVNR